MIERGGQWYTSLILKIITINYMKKTAKYYAANPKAKAKKDAYRKKYNKTKKATAGRVEDNKANRKAGTYGNGDGKDYDKTTKKMEPASKNRGRKQASRKVGSKRKKK
jgi:hypothetical protein